MKRRSFIAATLLSATLSTFAAVPTVSAQDADTPFYFVDMLVLQDGKTAADAATYFERIEPVVAKHGLVRAMPTFSIVQLMAGDLEANLLNIWTVTDPKTTFEGIFDDPDYLEHVPFRNSVFVMGDSTMFVLTPSK